MFKFIFSFFLFWLAYVDQAQACDGILNPVKEINPDKEINPVKEVEANFQIQNKRLIEDDLNFLKQMQSNAVPTYLELRNNAQAALKGSKKDFPFKPHRAVVERIAADTKQRQSRKFGDKYKAQLEAVHKKALRLLSKGDPPYKATIRFVMFEYLPVLDAILGERHPHLMANEFHRSKAEHLIEEYLALAPDFFIFISFEFTNDEFFVDTRPALMNLIGISLKGLDDDLDDKPYADNFYMKVSEFPWHDWGHLEYTSIRDLRYIISSGKPLERIVWEWEMTRRKIKAVVDQVLLRDRDLGEAMNQLLFELLRERGFQFSMTVLKQEFDTPKWVETIERKYQAKFYSHGETHHRKFKRLEEARQLLLKAVERIREESQLKWLTAVDAENVPAQITYTPALGYAKGRLSHIEIVDTKTIYVTSFVPKNSVTGSSEITTSINEMISAQVDPTKESPFDSSTIKQIEVLLWVKNQKKAVEVHGRSESVKSIFITKDKKIEVHLSSGLKVRASEVTIESPIPKNIPKFENLSIFKMNQVLGTEERGELQAFTIREKVQFLTGTIKITQDLISGHYNALVTTLNGKQHNFPLVQIRIDPWHEKRKED